MITSRAELRDFPLWAAGIVPERAIERQRRLHRGSWVREVGQTRVATKLLKAAIAHIRREREGNDP